MENSLEKYSLEISTEMARVINCVLLAIHTCFLFSFLFLHVYLMVIVNIFSIATYIGMFAALKKEKLALYVNCVYLEIVTHMSLATIAVGWSCGYQLYCFSAIPIIYYCVYLGKRSNHEMKVQPHVIAAAIALVFVGLRFYASNFEPVYAIPEEVQSCSFVINAIFVFVFLAYYMNSYCKMIYKSQELLKNLAEEDQLTEIGNRHYIKCILENSYDTLVASGIKIAAAIIDIDDFKKVNDTYGHDCGDEVLRELARRLKKIESETTKIARWGGEEFLILSMDGSGKTVLADQLNDFLRQMRQQPITYNGIQLKVTVTGGVSEYHETDRNFKQIIKRADIKLYDGKEKGKNQIVDC